jgi:hypothetical protein
MLRSAKLNGIMAATFAPHEVFAALAHYAAPPERAAS